MEGSGAIHCQTRPNPDTLASMKRSVVRYWPVPIGILTGIMLLWFRGELLVLDGTPAGYQWPAWVYSAWNWRQGHLNMMDPFRDPLHSVLVGTMGERLGYPDAALVVAGLSMVVVLVAATMIATFLGDRWAGALTAVTVPLSPVVVSGARWGSGYPLAAAMVGLTVAAAAWFLRRPGLKPLLLCSVGVALGLLTDDRCIFAVPPAVVLVGWGAVRQQRRWLRLAPLALVAAAAVGHTGAPWLGQFNGLDWEKKKYVQKRVVHRWATTDAMGADMKTACWNMPWEVYLTYDYLGTECAVEIFKFNAEKRLPTAAAWPAPVLAVGFLLWGVRRRDFVVPVTVASVGAVVVVSAVMTPLPGRYLLILTSMLAPVVPVGIVTVLRRTPELVRAVACLAGALAIAQADPHAESRKNYERNDAKWSRPGGWAATMRQQMRPGDELLDCADAFVEVAMLPELVNRALPNLTMPDERPCHIWLAGAPASGMRFVLVSVTSKPERADFHAQLDQSSDWWLVMQREEVALWRRGPVTSTP